MSRNAPYRTSVSSTRGLRWLARIANDPCNRSGGEVIRRGIYPYRTGAAMGDKMDLHCPNCNSTDLKKASLAYQEGLYRVDTRTRLRGVFFGSGGPDLVVGRARTKGSHQTELSKRLSPPIKWSYLRVISWSVLGFLSLGWLIFYV